MFDFDLQEGQVRQTFGAYIAQIEVTVRGVQVQWYADGQVLKRMPVEIKRAHAGEWKAFQYLHKNLEKMFVVQRRRLERLPLIERSWLCSTWQERYLQHPLLRILARNLIWQVRSAERSDLVIWHQGHFVNNEDQPVALPVDAEVQIWHPLMSDAQEVMQWRLWLEQHHVVQPFKQAHRELYQITEEEHGKTFSLRFAGHYLAQYPFGALAGARDWQYAFVDNGVETDAILSLPHWNCQARFKIKVDSYEYRDVITGKLSFFSENEGETGQSQEMQLDQVPALAFSEVVRDLDLFVSVTSMAVDMENDHPLEACETPLDRYIQHYRIGELLSSGYERLETLTAPGASSGDC